MVLEYDSGTTLFYLVLRSQWLFYRLHPLYEEYLTRRIVYEPMDKSISYEECFFIFAEKNIDIL